MEETRGDKSLRFVLIGLCVLLTLGGFLYSPFTKLKVDEPEQSIHAEVLSIGNGNRDPIIAVAKMVEKQQVPVIYELDRDNDYYFKVIHSVSLDEKVKTIRTTTDENGIWVKVDKKQWVLFSKSLDVLRESERSPSSIKSSQSPFHIQKDPRLILLSNGKQDEPIQLNWSNQKEKPVECHSLYEDHSLWLVVLQDDVVLTKSQ